MEQVNPVPQAESADQIETEPSGQWVEATGAADALDNSRAKVVISGTLNKGDEGEVEVAFLHFGDETDPGIFLHFDGVRVGVASTLDGYRAFIECATRCLHLMEEKFAHRFPDPS